jgi:hypothetical protein
MMSYSNSLLFREAGILINRPVTIRTIARFRHPRTGFTTLLLLSTTTELVVINLVPQQDPQSDSHVAHLAMDYSYLSATMGSTLVARCAGM